MKPDNDKAVDTRLSGMTLVEVMIASLLLVSVLSTFLVSFISGRRAQAQSASTMDGVHYARQIMETIKAGGYFNPGLSYGTHTFSNGSYVVTATGSYPSTKDILLTVYWTDPGTYRTSYVSLATSMSEALHD